MSAYYNEGIQVIVGNGQNFPGTPRVSLIPFIQRAYDKGLLNFTTLPPGSISLAEIQNISTSKLLGRSTAGTGVIEELTIGTGLSLAGGILSSTATASPPGGSDTQIQYNNAGVFAGSSYLTTTATNNLDISGSGSTSSTNALRVRNLAGGGLFRIDNSGTRVQIGDWTGAGYGSRLVFTRPSGGTDGAAFSQSNANFDFNDGGYPFRILTNTIASGPALTLSGTGYSGGTTTTTKPTLLIEPTGTTSTGWSTSGTKLGINAESGFTGNLFDLQLNGVSHLSLLASGIMIRPNNSAVRTQTVGSAMYLDVGTLVIRDGDAGTTNNKIAFGAVNTALYPMIKRNGVILETRFANDSGYTPIQSLYDRFGSGSPEGVVSAPVGAVYHRTNGGTGTSLYVKETGSTGNTGWVAK